MGSQFCSTHLETLFHWLLGSIVATEKSAFNLVAPEAAFKICTSSLVCLNVDFFFILIPGICWCLKSMDCCIPSGLKPSQLLSLQILLVSHFVSPLEKLGD